MTLACHELFAITARSTVNYLHTAQVYDLKAEYYIIYTGHITVSVHEILMHCYLGLGLPLPLSLPVIIRVQVEQQSHAVSIKMRL